LSGFATLIDTAKANNVIFFSTPFDEVSADFLEELEVPFYKIGSGELTHHRLLRYVAKKGKPIVISSGMAKQEQIDSAIRVVKEAGNEEIILTHCVSIYPAPVELVNMRAMPALRERLGVLVGYSDHTLPSSAPMSAVALGACYIEKHFSISRALPGGDNPISTEPNEFRTMVQGIREVEASLGTSTRSLLPQEEGLVAIARRGIYARNDIAAGQKIDSDMLAVRRPLSEIPADEIDSVVGKVAKVAISAEEMMTWDQLSG
jgi:N,N'-diacetyllegionaminate synthase